MPPLCQRMLADRQLWGLAPKTQEAYALAVRQLAEYYGKSPDLISEEELPDYFSFLKNEKKISRNTTTQALCGFKFFFGLNCLIFLNWEGIMPITIPITELKQRTGSVLSKVAVNRKEIIIERYGQEYVVILSKECYQELLDAARSQLRKNFREALQEVYRVTKDVPRKKLKN